MPHKQESQQTLNSLFKWKIFSRKLYLKKKTIFKVRIEIVLHKLIIHTFSFFFWDRTIKTILYNTPLKCIFSPHM